MHQLRVLAKPAWRGAHRNPYPALLSDAVQREGVVVEEFRTRLLLRGDYDLWHLHWPEQAVGGSLRSALLGLARLAVQLRLARWRGTSVVWTVHNLHAHEARHPFLERLLKALLSRHLGGYLTLTDSARPAVEARLPRLRGVHHATVPLGHFREVFPHPPARAEARDALGLPASAPVVAFAGLIRAYKNVPELIAAFSDLPDPGALLLVCGEPGDAALRAAVTGAARGDPRVRLDLHFLHEEELERCLAAADLIVLPFAEVLNSASAMLALSLDRPILVPDRGAMAELAGAVGEEWVRLYRGSLSAQALAGALTWARAPDRPARPPLEPFAWTTVAAGTVDAYAAVRELSAAPVRARAGRRARSGG